MIKWNALPLVLVVATLTFVAELTLVGIVIFVARHALRSQLGLVQGTLFGKMATGTFHSGMAVAQAIRGITRVVECALLPVFRIVACFALISEATAMSFVLIIVSMTGNARLCRL